VWSEWKQLPKWNTTGNGHYNSQSARRCVLWVDEQEVARVRDLHQQPAALKIRHRWLADVVSLYKTERSQ
jgi:hypothetical protein